MEKPWFDGVVALVILLNLLMVAMESLDRLVVISGDHYPRCGERGPAPYWSPIYRSVSIGDDGRRCSVRGTTVVPSLFAELAV